MSSKLPNSAIVAGQFVVITLFVILLVLTLTGCKSKESLTRDNYYNHDTCYIERCKIDTVVKVEADTALTRLLVECDEHNNALVAILESNQGEHVISVPVVRYVTIKDTSTNELRRKAYIDISALALEQQNTISMLKEKIAQGNTTNKELTEQLKQKPKTGGFWSYLLALILGALFGVWLCFKFK